MPSLLIYALSFLLCLFSVSRAGKIGAFRFKNFQNGAFKTYDPLARRHENTYIGKLTYSGGARTSIQSPRTTKLQNLLNRLPYSDRAIPDGDYVVHMVVRQQNAAAEDVEASDLNTADHTTGAASLNKHVKKSDCVDDATHEVLEFEISQHTNNHLSMPDLLDSECASTSYKDRKSWTQNSYSLTEKTTAENCANGELQDAHLYRELQGTFTAPQETRTERLPAHECVESGEEEVLSFQPEATPEVFTESYVLEEECTDNADALEAAYVFNAGDRWTKSNRGDGATVSTELTVETTAALPFFKNVTLSSSTSMTTTSGSGDYAVGQEINRESALSVERNTLEPAFTLTAWVKGHGTIFTMASEALPEACGRKSAFLIESSGKPKNDWGCSDTHGSSLLTNTAQWTHVAFRYDGYGTRSIVIGSQEQTDVQHDTGRDYFTETGSLLSPTTHNAVIQRYNELGDVIGAYEGYSARACFEATLSVNHIYFQITNGVCRSSATKGSGSAFLYRRSIQYMITEADFSGQVTHGPFSGQVDEVLLFDRYLKLETIQEVAAHMTVQGRFDGTSRIDHALTGMGTATKVSWTRYADFTEEQKPRADCYDSSDERYSKALVHPTYSYSGEGRGYAVPLDYTPYSGGLENVSSFTLPVQNSLRLCNQEHFDTQLVLHSYQETTHDECMAQQVYDGVCLQGDSIVPSTRSACAGTFFPSRAYTWKPDDYEILYDVSEAECTLGGDSWGLAQPMLFGSQHRNVQIFSDHEMTFYWKNKVGGDSYEVNRSSLESMKEWCRGTITCAGLQLDGDIIYPVERAEYPQNDSSYGFRVCDERLRKPIETAMQCFLHAANTLGPENLVYISGDEYRTFAWGYIGTVDGQGCYLNNGEFRWSANALGDRLCSDEPSDYEFLPFEQSRWQRDNDSITSTKEDDCTLHKIDWQAHNKVYETVGSSSRPHFVLQGQKSWQREPVDCLYATDATFPINRNTAKECRDEAIYWGATGYSFQDQGAEFLYLTARHFTHVEEAREECKRLHAHRDGPENTWDLCTNAQYDCAADDSCITSDTPDDTIFAVAACCFNTGTSCAITTNTDVCTPKNGYESFSFRTCLDEIIENTTNTTYNVYNPVWTRSEWRDETRSRSYDPAYYDIVEQTTACDRRSHLSYDECLAEKAKAAYSGLTWLGKVYDRERIAGCAVEGTDIYYNAYRYDSAKQPESGDKVVCRRHFEHFTETLDYSSTNCRYMNHELEVSKATMLECQSHAEQTGYTVFSFNSSRCLLAKDRGPCEEEAGWQSRFFVSPDAVEQFQKNPNEEYSVLSILECAENTTAESRVVQVSWGPEAHGVAWKLPSNAVAYSSESEAQTACVIGCPAIYTDGTNYYALDRLEAENEMHPDDASYGLHKYRIRNVENFQNKRLATHFLSNSKEDCHAECIMETTCRMVQYVYGQCIFYDQIFETLPTDKLSFVVYQEIKGAVSYGPTGDCWLYKNYVGKRFSASSSDGDCREILQTGTGYYTFPVDERLAGENKVVYLLTEPNASLATTTALVHEHRSEEWCNNRDGYGSWTAYPDIVSLKEEDDCSGTWTRSASIERQNVLQRECELSDSKAISWTRNSDAVTRTTGKGGYALQYENGYALRLGRSCDALDLQEVPYVYGHACLKRTNCSVADQGHGFAVIEGDCFSYLYRAGSNASDCRWQRSLANAKSHLPIERHNFGDAVDACNERISCEGICENVEAQRRTFTLAKSSITALPSCHTGWTGEDCSTLLPSEHRNKSITEKRHTAIDYCSMLGQRLCPQAEVGPGYACLHVEEGTTCPLNDYSSIDPVAFCCGRTEKSGKMLLEAVYYERVKEVGQCAYAKEFAGSMVLDRTPKLKDTYLVEQIAKALCVGGTSATGDCEAACLADPACTVFSNSSTSCTLHGTCSGFFNHFYESAASFRLRRKQGRYDTPQELHGIIGDCKYHYTVRDANVVEQASYGEADDPLVSWRCERATVPLDRRLSLLRHSINETFKYDVIEDHHLNDTQAIELTYQQLNYSDSTEDSLQDCLNKNEGKVISYDESSKRCRTFHDSPYVIPTQALFLGQSYRSAGLFEEFQVMTDVAFEKLDSIQPVLTVSDWKLSSAQDECEVFCLENNCEGYLMQDQTCSLIRMPNTTMVDYLRVMEPVGQIIVRLRTASELTCRPFAAGWRVTEFEVGNMPPLETTETIGNTATLKQCKQMFLNDPRTPRLDTLLYDSTTGECRISLLRDVLVEKEGPSSSIAYEVYRIARTAQNPVRTEATRYETEDISRETCLPTAGLLGGRDCNSIECAAFWFREEDVIRHEVTEEQCNPSLPPAPPLLSFAWDRNRQGTLTFNVEEDTCRSSEKFMSWRTGTEGVGKIVVESEADCLNRSTDEVTAVYLGNEPLPDHRSACNGIVEEHSFERLFPHPIIMAYSESTRMVSLQESIDECAAHANAYYAHQNRSTESKVFEYNFVTSQCAIFAETECPTLCLPDENPDPHKHGFFAFRLHGETGMTAASCWILSVLDSRSTGNTYCRQCPLGKHSARAGSNCLPCQQGRYADETGLRACKSCPEGKFQFGSGETHCHNCPAGSYQDIGEGERSCKLCAAGKYEQNNECLDCPVGKAAPNNFLENSAGELVFSGSNYKGPLMYYDPRFDYSDVHGISYKNADGTYMKGYSPIFTALRKLQMEQHDSPDDCVSCAAGSYSDESGASECKACEEGSFSDQTGATSCTDCDAGLIARPDSAAFHELMPFACFSAEELGEYRYYDGDTDTYTATGEDVGLIREEPQAHVEECFQSCKAEKACLFVSYKEGSCRLHRKCDERGEAGWTAYRLSKSSSSISESTNYALSVEATVYGPSHHECEEQTLLVAPETYIHRADQGISVSGTIDTALTFQDAIDKCNLRRDCIGFTYAGAEDVSLRIFSEDAPILLKSQGDLFEQTGLQSWFKEQPIETKEDCQQQCAMLDDCRFMEWDGRKVCRKWGHTCTPKKKASLAATESSLFQIGLASSFQVFPFRGSWPCDAVVFTNKTRTQCEEESVARLAPMFYHDGHACHVFLSYANGGIDLLFSGLVERVSSVCVSGNTPPPFDNTLTGSVYAIGSRKWDMASKECAFCPAGLNTEKAGAFICRQCQAGSYDQSPRSNMPCMPCELGRFQDEPGQSTCKACSAGRYQDEQGQHNCKASGQGHRAVNQGFAQSRNLREQSSGPLQNNTYANSAQLDFEGATAREICGRNSFANGYENVNCKKVPVGAVSVTRERTWTREASNCLYDNSSVVGYRVLDAGLPFYAGDLFNRMGMHSLDDCIAFVNEQSTVLTAGIIAVSFGGGNCHLLTETTDGIVPECIAQEAFSSAFLSVGETQYDSESSGVDPEWLQKWTPHDGVRFVSPYQCKLIHYEDVGDYFSAKDCINACRQQKNLNKAACRYVSYSSSDNRCFFVNWDDVAADPSDGSGQSNVIFENTLANIEVACSYGSRTVPLDTTDNEPGSGGYRIDAITGTSSEHYTPFEMTGSGTVFGKTMNITAKRDQFGLPSIGLGGDRGTVAQFSPTDESFYSSNPPTSFSSFVSGTLTLRMGHYGDWVDFEVRLDFFSQFPYVVLDIYFTFVDSIQCEDGRSWSWGEDGVASSSQYDSYDLTLDGQEELDDNRKIEIDFGESATLCAFTVKQKLVSDNRECEAAVSSTRGQYYLRASTDIDCYVYATHGQTGDYYYFDFQGYFAEKVERTGGQIFASGTQAQNAARHKNGIVVDCAGDCADPNGEWQTPECDTAAERSRSGFESDCRWSRRRFYDRIKTSLLQDHTLPTNVFPDYNINGGYQGNNLLRTLGFINFVDHNDESGSSSGPLHISYVKVTHISYDHDSIMPLFDVGTNDDDFDTTDLSLIDFRARKAANSFEYCSGSTTQRSAPFLPTSCDDLGYPFVIDSESSQSGTEKVCMKVDETDTKCCIGPDCTGSPIPRCMDIASYSGLSAVSYEVSQYLSFDPSDADFIVEHSENDQDVGIAYAKDRCSQLGEFCLGVSSHNTADGFFSYAHGQATSLKLKESEDRDLLLKLADFSEYGQATVEGASKEDGVDTLQGCFQLCLQTAFCEMFAFRADDRGCFLQRDIFAVAVESSTQVLFKLYKNVDDQSKAQFCTPCTVGTTASDANRGGTGVCQACEPGEISSTSDLFVTEEQIGLSGQEECKPCPAGMMYLAITASCVACPEGFTCPREGSYLGVNVAQCNEHEYSTSSLLDFSGEDISTKASLRCATCTAGKYSNKKGSEYCEKCPKGFFSRSRSACQPCPAGFYTLTTASEECFPVDSQSFISWPASTLSDKRLCESSQCPTEAESRTCIGIEDAYCQSCPEVRPGHRTYYDGTACQVDPCEPGTYSTAGCIGKDCCIPCTSNCKAGQHSVGCGDPVNDVGGSTQNTQCQDCPVNTFTEFDAVDAPCVETGAGPNFGSQGSCSKCAGAPHKIGSGFTTKSPFKYLGVSHPQTHYDQRRCAAGNINTGSPTNSFADTDERLQQCCSAAAYQCIPCRSSEKVSYSYSYNIGGKTHRWGRTSQPAWSTDGLTGQTFCQSYWHVWNKATRDAIVKFDAKYAPSPAPSSCFPSVATVETPKGKKAIYEIKVGDFVLSHEGFSEVYLLGHADNETLGKYVRITTDNATSIRLSAEHFILSNSRYVYAKDVKEGDRLAYGETVILVETEQAKGLWNPFTLAGTIVVDGIVASCHSDWFLEELPEWLRPSAALIPSIYQTLMAPARKIYERNKAWVKRFTESFEGKAIGEHSLTAILGKMWKSYWQKEESLG